MGVHFSSYALKYVTVMDFVFSSNLKTWFYGLAGKGALIWIYLKPVALNLVIYCFLLLDTVMFIYDYCCMAQ